VSRLPPARCGIAEYTSMLAESLVRNLSVVEVALIGTKVKEGVRHYVEPYSGLDVLQCFAEEGGYRGIIECIESTGAREDTVVHVQHDYDIFRNNAEFMEFLRGLKGRGLKIAVTLHTVAHALKDVEYVEFQRALSKLVDVIIVHSILQEYELIAQGADPRKITRIPHGTLLNPYISYSRSKLLRSLAIDIPEGLDKSILITVPGLIRPVKGLETFLEAFKTLRSKYDVKFILIGSPQGQGYEYLRKLAPLLAKLEGVIFMNKFLWRNELLTYLAAIDIAVFPYRDIYHYAVSGIFHMVMGSRKPAVCTKIPKLVECYELAPEFTIPTGDAEEIAKKVEFMINNPDIVKDALDRLWKYAQETSWDNVALMHMEAYLRALES